MRLFVALDPSAEARAGIAAWRDRWLAGRDDLRPVAEEALHLTLVFLGSRPDGEVPRIARAAFGAAGRLPAPRLAPLALEPVPSSRPRLFALGLEDSGGAAGAIQAAVSDALAGGGFYEPEERPFWPHITLARVKKGRGEGRRLVPSAVVAGASLAANRIESFTARELTLYRSTPRPQGALYEPLERLMLPGPAPPAGETDIDPAIGGQT